MALRCSWGRSPLLSVRHVMCSPALHHQHRILDGACVIILFILFSAVSMAYAGYGAGHQETHPSSPCCWQLGRNKRSLLQLGQIPVDNGGSWPPAFTDMDRAIETQRILKNVASERNKTAVAMQNMDAAWTGWLQTYKITFKTTDEATYRKTVFNYNLQQAYKLNQLAGPEVAFGLNRFSTLTPQEFLANYTGDTQNDQGITVTPDNPQQVSTPAADYLATLTSSISPNSSNTPANSAGSTGSPVGPAGGGAGTAVGGGSTPGGNSKVFSIDSERLPGAMPDAAVYSGDSLSSGGARRLHQRQQRQQRQQQLQQQQLGIVYEEQAHELGLLRQFWEHWRQGRQQQPQQHQMAFWRRILAMIGMKGFVTYGHRASIAKGSMPMLYDLNDEWHSRQQSSNRRSLHQVITPSASFPGTPPAFCSRQVAFPYQYILPFKSVDWLRAQVVRPVQAMSGKCNNSFAYVAAALAETTMLIEGYNGTAQDISEAQLMECFPGGSCTRGGSVHVLLNYLACNGVAAAGSGSGQRTGAYPSAAVDAGTPGQCAVGKYNPVRTGVTGWAYVPNTEHAFSQALSKTPIKVSVDAAILQSYRAGYVGCNVLSSAANHALLAVGYNYQVRAGAPPPGSGSNFTFFAGLPYWMLKNSWGLQGSVDGYVYVRKGCEKATPLGMTLNRGVMPIWNQSESYRVGRLQCTNDTNSNQGCGQDVLLRLSGYCAGVDDYLPTGLTNNCSCSCIPT